ncbi:MAG: Chromosomal replication initiator protein DnaA [Candidatus Giovannonibacteria bacterium GW2011_GWC2_44_9]|uniref:Chromosomal replication initiator protein DnaA n=3 Tax=Candidatus Giovannoniibacteriota TaxID=1752738 RepID=A0A0G1IVR2_9BACT|nr:MAG: Chromosomal replication initiator protein DnaA [Candidatus Giovannonibacteria bacterium GW2011_GWB1_44_23]KKT63501.1 MAG: Chromosomal replication initiator protein DnaA [Candidatus Giovannonibacteria bacterium GW2011_GWA1_44_29]KKT83733.1 MAG: Chromosomal replication initiator protein DnaA [Candidatus Giovannonibacteria bacterium GW2011_GWC2_44_9]KKT91456.1 MAG: chromosomal replication initiator protein DnaA, chromosomal replication initiator protein [Parcubacteria group bacterium GW2011
MTNEELWGRALIEIELAVSRANFVTWFKDTRILDFEEGAVTVGVPNGFSKEWLENKFHKFILKSLRTHAPEIRAINYSIATPSTSTAAKIKFKKELPSLHEEQLEFKDFYVDPKTNLNPKYTLDTFVVGSFNELAHAAALAVIKSLGRVYNPLFLYGGVGLGKTHLLQAIGNAVIKENPGKKVHYITSEKFSNELVSSLQNNYVHNFKEKYREFDLLIVDDVQFFAGKTKTQEEFFYTFNALYEAGKQVVFSSDRSPKSISDIGERLQSRMEAGVIIDISEPEYESRLAILKSKMLEKNIDLPGSTIELIAVLIHKNIRELEGALNTINIRSKYQNRALTQDEVKTILNKNIKPKNTVTPNQIIKTVAEFYDIQEKAIYEHTRKTEVVKPRQVAMYLIREDLKGSYPFIGQKFGGMDHTTAIHAYEKIVRELKKDSKLDDELKSIRNKYQNIYK